MGIPPCFPLHPLGFTITPSLASPTPVCREAASLCETLSAAQDTALDVAPELTRAVTNVVCSLCFNSSYRRGDPEFEAMLEYSQGIVDTVAKESLVDIFPWLQVSRDMGAACSCHLRKEEGAGICPAGGTYLSLLGLGGSLPQCPARANTLVGTERLPEGPWMLG